MHKLLTKQNILVAVWTALHVQGAALATECETATQALHCNLTAKTSASWLPQAKTLLESILSGIVVTETATGQLQLQHNSLTYLLTPVQVTQANANSLIGINLTGSGQLNLTTRDLQTITFAPNVQGAEVWSQFLTNSHLELTKTDADTGTLFVTGGQGGRYFALRPDFSSEPAQISNTPGFYLMPYLTNKIANIQAAFLVFKDGSGQLRQQVLPPMPADWDSLKNGLSELGFNASLQYDGIISATSNQGKTYYALMDYTVTPGNPIATLLKTEVAQNDINQDGVPDLTVIYPNGDRQQLILFPDAATVFTLKSAADVANADAFLAAHEQPVTLELDFANDGYSGDAITLANFTAGDKIRFNTADGSVHPGVDVQHSATANQYMSSLQTAHFQHGDRIIHAVSKADITLISSALDLQNAELKSNSLHIHLSGGIKNNNLQFEFY